METRTGAADSAPDEYRLPDDVTPDRYELVIAPDLDDATFTGSVAISCTVHVATRQITCNAAELTIDGVWIEAADGSRADGSVTFDEAAERVTFIFDQRVPPGPATVHVRFAGVLNDKLRGFYRSTFTDDGGATRVIGTTQFEATDARRAFPCWDEPAYKAVFGVTLEVDDDLLAISNGPELHREQMGDGKVRVVFADTMPMSTYLVAFVVGPLEVTDPVDVDGIPLRIVHRPGQRHLCDFALEVGAFALRYFTEYYGIIYPGDKMDMVAVPDFAFGAMENLGCVIYRETLLLVDPDTATQAELQSVCDVIAHELAHMWFGDLVTMAWWNGIWLNEAFATFMELKCTDAFRPEWKRWLDFGRERNRAFDTDSLGATRAIEFPVHSPEDAEAMFDILTYVKGSAVVRMLEQYLGEEPFRAGIRRYLQAHQFANTETGDLWDSLEEETGVPVRSMMDSWIFSAGYPLVSVATGEGGGLVLDQQPFRYLDDDGAAALQAPWEVPVVVRAGDAETRVVLTDPVPVDGAGADGDGVVMANGGGHGFYRVNYSDDLYARLVGGIDRLSPMERFAVVDDAHGLLLRGDIGVAQALGLVERLVAIGEDDLSTWQQAIDLVGVVDRIVPDAARDGFNGWRRATLAPVWDRLGPEPTAGDDSLRRALRGLLLSSLAHADHAPALEQAAAVFGTMTVEGAGAVDPGLASGALGAVARVATEAEIGVMLDRYRNGDTPQEQLRYLYAMAAVDDPALFRRYLDLLADGGVRSQNLAFAVRGAIANFGHGAAAWRWCTERWEWLADTLPFNSMHRMVEGVVHFNDPALAADVQAFMDDHPIPQAVQPVAQHLERMWVSVRFAARDADAVAAYVSA